MITTRYADYMNSDIYRRYLNAEDNCRTAFASDAPVKPQAKAVRHHRTGALNRYLVKNTHEIVGMKVEFDRFGRSEKLEFNGRELDTHIYRFLNEDLKWVHVDAGGKVDVIRHGENADDPKCIGMPIHLWDSHHAGVEAEEVIQIVQNAIDYYGGVEALAA